MKDKERVVIITGSTMGIGFEAAKKFIENGDKVTIFCRHSKHVREAQEELLKIGPKNRILGMTADVTSYDDVARVVRETLEEYGKIDILVNNAGIAVWKPLEETTEKEMMDIIDTNLLGQYRFAREVIPFFKIKNSGTIINISSGLGEYGAENYSIYSASKFGVLGLTESLADELKKTEIKVYVALPGAVATKLHEEIHPWEDKKEMMTPEYIAEIIFKTAEGKLKSGEKIRIYS